ncbi:MAG: hypothetical protein H6R10_490 [Rhodocyclaceae bacterium]|nr:hypothetical protein [Rhodocyclaceae bacterium]
MIQLPLVLQAYTPQLHLGDWQIVVFVNRRRNRISVERWHSSEKAHYPLEETGQMLRIDTGIRAFRRQMPVLANALDEIDMAGMDDEQIIHAIFRALANLYRAAPQDDQVGFGGEGLTEREFADFLEEKKQEALAALTTVKH